MLVTKKILTRSRTTRHMKANESMLTIYFTPYSKYLINKNKTGSFLYINLNLLPLEYLKIIFIFLIKWLFYYIQIHIHIIFD